MMIRTPKRATRSSLVRSFPTDDRLNVGVPELRVLSTHVIDLDVDPTCFCMIECPSRVSHCLGRSHARI
jgi:hypothetical protein